MLRYYSLQADSVLELEQRLGAATDQSFQEILKKGQPQSVVETAGFEPATPRTPCECSTKLSHISIQHFGTSEETSESLISAKR